jgi:hypothetical protein
MNKIMKSIAMFMVWLTVICVCAYILLTMAGMLIMGLELAELIDLSGDMS